MKKTKKTKQTEPEPKPVEKDPTEIILFCPGCFGSDEDSSWGGEVTGAYCYNCGHGAGLPLPRWAVRSIRQQASWVGKRYYTHSEDREVQEELEDLRKLPKTYPGRSVREWVDNQDGSAWWIVEQKLPGGTTVSSMVSKQQRKTAKDALKWAITRFRYVPAHKLKEKKP